MRRKELFLEPVDARRPFEVFGSQLAQIDLEDNP